MSESNAEFFKKENVVTINETKEVVGEFWPSCACYQMQEATEVTLVQIGGLAIDTVGEMIEANICPSAMPFSLLQLFAGMIAEASRQKSLAFDSGLSHEEMTCRYEDDVALVTANIAHLLPKLVARQAVQGRRIASMLGRPIAPVRRS